MQDQVTWWANVAKQAYAEVDGSLDGFEEQQQRQGLGTDSVLAGLSASEAELVKVCSECGAAKGTPWTPFQGAGSR